MERLAKSLALKMYNNQLIAYDSIDNYSYAIEMCAIRIIGWVILLSIAALIGWFLEICCYLLFFSVIRQYGGGIHLNSLFGCLFVSIALTILPVVLFQFGIPFSICQGGVILSMIFVILIGSVNNENIAWNTEEYRKAKRINRIIVFAEAFIIFISPFLNINDKYVFFMMYGMVSASISMLFDYLRQRGGDKNEEIRIKDSQGC